MAPLVAELPAPQSDPDEVRRVAEDVLSRPEYAWEVTLRDRIWAWFEEQLLRIIDAVTGTGQGRLIGTVVIIAGAAAVLWLAFRFGRGVRRAPSVSHPLDGPVGRTAAQWRAEAEEHERASRWRDAVRCRYRALIAELASAGAVEERPGRTAGEYLAEMRRRAPAASGPFEAVTRTFEVAWYGHEPVGPQEAAQLVAQSQRALAAARAPSWSDAPAADELATVR